MKFLCERTRLADVAGLVSQAVAGKSTKKIFECIRIHADESGLEFCGTDLEVSVRYRMAVGAPTSGGLEIREPGTAVVPAQLFAGILREIGDEHVSVAVQRQKLTLATDGGKFELECEDPTQFPEIPSFPPETQGSIGAADLRSLVRKTVFAAGKEAARFVLNGVRLVAGAEGIRFVATDGRRLATLERPLERTNGAEGRERSAIVGVKGLQHFERAAAEADGAVDLAIADRFVALRTAAAEVVVRVMEGTFPEVEKIIPDQGVHKAALPVGVFASRLRQVGKFASVESQSVVLEFKAGELELTAMGGEGRADVRMGIEYDGKGEKIGFNPAYLLDALKVVEGEQVTIEFQNRNSAAKLTDAAGLLYVVMPVLID